MNNITFYPSDREYAQVEVTCAAADDELELVQVQNNLGIGMKFNDFQSVKNPRFHVCRGKGYLQLNRSCFFSVKIADQLKPMLRYCSDVEVVLSNADDAVRSVYAVIERVLRVPEYVTRDLTAPVKKDIEEPDEPDEDEEEEEDEEKEAKTKWQHTPPAERFIEWLTDQNGEILMEYHGDDAEFLLAHNDDALLLVSFFDESDDTWLADEEEFDGEPPLWFSASGHRQSPLYAVGLAAGCLRKHGIGNVLPLAVMSDHIDIVNDEEMQEIWDKLGVSLCYCTRTEDFAAPFAEFLEMEREDHPESRPLDDESIAAAREILQDFVETEL